MRSGIFRKLDDVGRIVIPKEIRKYLKLTDGSPLEIGINEKGEVVLKSIEIKDVILEKINQIGEKLHKILNKDIIFVINFEIYKSFGKNVAGEISASIKNIIDEGKSYFACESDKTTLIPFLKDTFITYKNIVVVPIKNMVGSCIISVGLSEEIGIHEVKFIELVAKLIEE